MTDNVVQFMGGIQLRGAGTEITRRLTIILVGSAGTGKTTLAATAPGNKLWMLFDPEGDASLPNRADISIADFSEIKQSDAEQFIASDPWGISRAFATHDTIIVDSLTAVSEKSLERGIATSKGATIARPSLQGFGVRNSYTIKFIKTMISLTKQHNKHLILIAHEDVPSYNDDGSINAISIMLGGKLPEVAPKDISEVWWLFDQDYGKKKTIAFRPVRNRKPAKTRMFKTTGAPEFQWKFDPDKWKGDGIENWYNKWKENNYGKIDLPTG